MCPRVSARKRLRGTLPGTSSGMSDQDDRTPLGERQDPGPTSDGVRQEPRGNPEPDQEAVERGLDNLERVKPY